MPGHASVTALQALQATPAQCWRDHFGDQEHPTQRQAEHMHLHQMSAAGDNQLRKIRTSKNIRMSSSKIMPGHANLTRWSDHCGGQEHPTQTQTERMHSR